MDSRRKNKEGCSSRGSKTRNVIRVENNPFCKTNVDGDADLVSDVKIQEFE